MKDSDSTNKALGVVDEVLPDSLYRVRLVSEEQNDSDSSAGEQSALVLAYLAGKMRLNHIRVLVGDKVEMVLDPYGGRARIVRRLS